MDILIGSHYFPPHRGGIETVAYQHAKELSSRNHNVTVVTSDVEKAHSEFDFDLLRLPVVNTLEKHGIPYPIPHIIRWRRELRNLFNQNTFDIAHLHGINYLTTSTVASFIPETTPIIIHQHTPFVDYGNFLNVIEKANDNIHSMYLQPKSDRILAVSEKIREYACSLSGNSSVITFPNAVSVEEYTPRNGNITLEKRYNGKPLFFCLTRLIYKKGVGTLLEAAQLMSTDSQIIIAGSGPDEAEIRSRAKQIENVHVIGNLSDKELKEYYATATGFLFTSLTGDAFPTMSVLEAMSSGTPVITPQVDSYMNGFQHERNGYVLSEMNASQFATKMDTLTKNSALAEKMGDNCRKDIEENFSLTHRVDELVNHYREARS